MSTNNPGIHNADAPNRELLDSVGVDMSHESVEFISAPNPLLPRMDSESLLDVSAAASLYLPASSGGLPPPDQYPPEEILSPQDLTEEDRKLAAALVAVQLVQQQKQQQLSMHEASLSVSSNNQSVSNQSLLNINHISSEKITMGASIAETHSIQLPSMNKSQMTTIMSGYVSNNGATEIQSSRIMTNNSTLPHHSYVQLTSKKTELNHTHYKNNKNILKRPNNRNFGMGNRSTRYTLLPSSSSATSNIKEEEEMNCFLVKTEEDDLLDGSDDEHTDFDDEIESRSSKKSLPHKKRISRKLKNSPRKSAVSSKNINMHSKCYKCNRCGEQFPNQSDYSDHRAAFNGRSCIANLPVKLTPFHCQLCPEHFDNQFLFFEHLKGHYEPLVEISETVSIANRGVISDNIKALDTANKVPQMNVALPASNLRCCGKTFRRQKTFEAHVRDVHAKLEMEEFSEPEDLMDGIRVVVDSEDCDNENPHPAAVLSSHTPTDPLGHSEHLHPAVALRTPVTTHHMLTSNNIVMHNDTKVWYREDELHATEADLQELEAQQLKEQEQMNINATNSFVCHMCGAMFEQRSYLSQHLTECYLVLKQEAELLNGTHAAIDNTNNEDLKVEGIVDNVKGKKYRKKGTQLMCTVCGRVFNHRNSLVYHLRSHSGERPHQCEQCGKSFFATSALKVHMRLHSGDKPFKCEYCGRHFRQWGDLKYHSISIHSGQKQYQCEYCGKDFARKYSLIVHRRIHTGEKNYQCEYCNKTFRASSYLQNHRKIHTGEKPHPCDICGKPFRVRSDMKRHMVTHNRERLHKPPCDTKTAPLSTDSEQNDSNLERPTDELSEVAHIPNDQESNEEEHILPKSEINFKTEVHDVLQTPKEEDVSTTLYTVPADPLAIREGGNTLYVWPVYMN